MHVMSMTLSMLQGQNQVGATETNQLAEPKIFTAWPFTGKDRGLSSRALVQGFRLSPPFQHLRLGKILHACAAVSAAGNRDGSASLTEQIQRFDQLMHVKFFEALYRLGSQ